MTKEQTSEVQWDERVQGSRFRVQGSAFKGSKVQRFKGSKKQVVGWVEETETHPVGTKIPFFLNAER
jgi:hypothetical protein